jgi:hypothetical protein
MGLRGVGTRSEWPPFHPCAIHTSVNELPWSRTLVVVAGKSYDRTAVGREITDEMIEKLAAEAEAGYDFDAVLARSRTLEEGASDA